MFEKLRSKFINAFAGTLVWLVLLVTLFARVEVVSLVFLWKLIAIALIAALVFGILYSYLWDYSTNKSSTNVIISTCLNTVAGFVSIYLFSKDMFSLVLPYGFYIVLLTLFGHIIGFYFYSKYESQKNATALNKLIND